MKNIKCDWIINIKDVRDLRGFYIINQNNKVEKIRHIVDRENDFKLLRINGIYHEVPNLIFLKKNKEGLQKVEIRKIYEPIYHLINGSFEKRCENND